VEPREREQTGEKRESKRLEILWWIRRFFRRPSRKTKSPLTVQNGRKRRFQFSGTSGNHYWTKPLRGGKITHHGGVRIL